MPSNNHQLTPEQLALSEERKRKRAEAAEQKKKQEETTALYDPIRGRILDRQWISLGSTSSATQYHTVKVKTWNLLAQCLVRRSLFPASDCLKASQREDMTFNELLQGDADILCLQEVDRLDKLLPFLEKCGYSHHYAAGPRKKHGSLIAFKSAQYSLADHRLIAFDDQRVREDGDEAASKGLSFRTKNVGNLVALKRNDGSGRGLVVATTHLFWHPWYTYERTRQVLILKREVLAFRQALGLEPWPCLICGDFNFAPNDPAYALLVGEPLLPIHERWLATSRVVHVSVDPTVPITSKKALSEEDEGEGAATAASEKDEGQAEEEQEGGKKGGDEEANAEGGEETDPDRIITNARRATPADGHLSTLELATLAAQGPLLKSAYDDAQRRAPSAVICGPRYALAERRGAHEPMWTSYTHYWKTVLDYIMIIDGDRPSTVVGYLQPPLTEDLDPGIPRTGVCGSDHISLIADIAWSA